MLHEHRSPVEAIMWELVTLQQSRSVLCLPEPVDNMATTRSRSKKHGQPGNTNVSLLTIMDWIMLP